MKRILKNVCNKQRKIKKIKQIRSITSNKIGLGPKKNPVPWPEIGNNTSSTIWIDESGCGCYAGPLTIGAVYISDSKQLQELQSLITMHDSKLLKPHEREHTFDELLKSSAIIYHVESISNVFLDNIGGKQKAWKFGILEAVKKLIVKIHEHDETIVINKIVLDGRTSVEESKIPIETIIKGDQKFIGVSCASIMAKVTRDRYMVNIAAKYPKFEEIFRRGKGYRYKSTHDELIKSGVYTDIHRKSYNPLRTYLANK
jgi:ribonuclease HII